MVAPSGTADAMSATGLPGVAGGASPEEGRHDRQFLRQGLTLAREDVVGHPGPLELSEDVLRPVAVGDEAGIGDDVDARGGIHVEVDGAAVGIADVANR